MANLSQSDFSQARSIQRSIPCPLGSHLPAKWAFVAHSSFDPMRPIRAINTCIASVKRCDTDAMHWLSDAIPMRCIASPMRCISIV
ncbi:hypothetical protein PGTUg99_025930 [Puccinia graminis f. sp. tritici]|uniref:Uncharacterized protein n=1 Tax=Puccinia graminis f. sp. tritici TaxID=56615 RepID=A0A5B0R9F1_PUCGR|nr:hypothetical protein PGTUg99_025930 [Puccinia graminis f. sp. tritici]